MGDGARHRPIRGVTVAGGTPSTRERLIDATEGLLCEGGFAAVTTQSVARAAGVAEGTLYRHFESRDELVAATIRERLPAAFERLLDDMLQRAGRGDIESNVADFIRAAMPCFTRIAPFVSMLAADPPLAARHYEALREMGRGPRHNHELLAAYFREEQRLGRIRLDVDPRAAAALVMGMCFDHSLMLQLFGEDPSGLTDDELPTTVASIVARGLHERTRDLVGSQSQE